ncbi:hypothetical protein SB778_04445 [Paraburkholderia sp. SIMBA_050]|jgi:hypothetical protein|uniref:hypothetical protein n=1 Tax=Paraburkholderia TaxID=1822464 RepID=UPI0012B947AA
MDEGVSVLIEADEGCVPDIFSVDRLDGEPLVTYPEAGDASMIVNSNRRVGGADVRHVHGGFDS